MTTLLALILALALGAIAILHFYWAYGGVWPGEDERSLAKTVVGDQGITRMPPKWLTAVVAVAILIAAIWPLFWTGVLPFPLGSDTAWTLVWLGMWVIAMVFVGRGLIAFTPFYRRTQTEEPFASLDAKYYSPLCLVLGIGFLILIYSGANH